MSDTRVDHDHGSAGHDHAPSGRTISRRDRAAMIILCLVIFTLAFRSQLAFISAWRADNLAATGHNAQALSVARRALLLTPNDPLLLDVIGFAAYRSGRIAEAERAYGRVVALRPGEAPVWQALGLLYARERRYQAAIPAYERAVRLGPQDLVSWRGLALSQERAGMLSAAAATWERYAKRFPAYDGATQARRVRALMEGKR